MSRTPKFANPPVIEVALGVQFASAIDLRVVDYGRIRDAYAPRFPSIEEQAPLPRVVEAFGDEPQPAPEESVKALFNPRARFRLWFTAPDSASLIQLQADKFVFNWRKTDERPDYPGFDSVLDHFRREFAHYRDVLAELKYSAPEVELCEVTYVNHIVAGAGWNNYSEIDSVFPDLRIPTLTNVPGAMPETADVQLRFATVDSVKQHGRLHFRVFPANRASDGAKLFAAHYVARSRPSGVSDGVLAALRDEHDWIVLAFRDMTSEAMHKLWGVSGG